MKTLFNLLFLVSIFSFAQPTDLGFQLNGSNDFLVTPNTPYINTSSVSNRTVETWFKTNDASNKQVIFEEGGGVNAILIYLDSGKLYAGAYKSNGASTRFFKSGTGDIQDDTWYHVAFVISTVGNTTTFSWYLNGELKDSMTGFVIPSHSGDIQIGRNGKLRYANCSTWSNSSITGSSSKNCSSASSADTTKYYFSGNVWGLRIWNSARTIEEINDNMNTELSEGTNLVAYLDNDSVNYQNSTGGWSIVTAYGNDIIYKWLANADSTNWNASENWQGNNVPSATNLRKVIIPESEVYPTISSELRIGKLELTSANAEIIIEDGGTLNVYYSVDNKGTIRVKNNGSFILQDDEPITGEGRFIIERDTPDYPGEDFYSIWSTPVAEEDSQLGAIFTNNVVAYAYDASQNPSAYVQIGESTNLEEGKGYFIRSDDDAGVLTRTFTGKANNGTIEETIYHNSQSDDFNLIGNPYASALDWSTFYKDNAEVLSGTVYFWSQDYSGTTNSASDFVSFNATGSSNLEVSGKIGTGQGFFVKSLQAGNVKFKNTQRVVGNNNEFFRNSENPNEGKSWFKLSGSMGYSSILIGFVPEATDEYESTFDSEFMNEGANIEFYSLIDSNKYDIQGRSELQANQFIDIPLGYEVLSAGDYTISIMLEHIDSAYDIILEDTLENTMTDLRSSDYIFTVVDPTEDNSRFILHYNYNETLSTVSIESTKNEVNSYFRNDELVSQVDAQLEPVSIVVYDITGKQILNQSYANSIHTVNLTKGIYVVNYIMKNSQPISRKLIKK